MTWRLVSKQTKSIWMELLYLCWHVFRTHGWFLIFILVFVAKLPCLHLRGIFYIQNWFVLVVCDFNWIYIDWLNIFISSFLTKYICIKTQFYHDVGEISDLSQSEAPNLVMWRVRVMQPMTPSPWRRGRSWPQFNVQENGSMKCH